MLGFSINRISVLNFSICTISVLDLRVKELLEADEIIDFFQNDVGLLSTLREIQGLICSFLHQMFIADISLAKLVHFQVNQSFGF